MQISSVAGVLRRNIGAASVKEEAANNINAMVT